MVHQKFSPFLQGQICLVDEQRLEILELKKLKEEGFRTLANPVQIKKKD
jgi:hypothetical protein